MGCDFETLCLEQIDGSAAGLALELLLFAQCFVGIAAVGRP